MAIYTASCFIQNNTAAFILSQRHGTMHTKRFSKVTEIGELQLKKQIQKQKISTQRGWPFGKQLSSQLQ